ncbi:hypothetical protein QWY97_18625 [Vibrio cortegadensis]|uniref:hypothetical protein n=1 Tax=Vibrio cortegadensis TaxID=1328770 RepID=UPI0021C44382|nr:hypothetical protein [Vibrio cortegadensis]MDN3699337.1 hypothetical protein [Vibrio cortegadensis]
MKLEDTRDNYYISTASLSTVTRQLAMAGIAVVWIFVQKSQGSLTIPSELMLPLSLFVTGLGTDLLQYIYSSAAWGVFNRYKELSVSENDDFTVSPFINWPTNLFFWSKCIVVCFGYIKLLLVLY